MQVLPIDVTSLVAVILGISIVLVPVIGLTARFALKPVVDAFGRFIAGKGTEESVAIVERRLALLEQQLDSLQGSVNRLLEVAEFDHELRAGPNEPRSLPEGREEAPS